MSTMGKTSALVGLATLSELIILGGQGAIPSVEPFGPIGTVVGTVGLIIVLWWVIRVQMTEKKALQKQLKDLSQIEKERTEHNQEFLENLNVQNREALAQVAKALRERPCLMDLELNGYKIEKKEKKDNG